MKKLFTTFLALAAGILSANAQSWTVQLSNVDPNNWVQFIDAVDSNVCWGLASSRLGQTTPAQEYTKTADGGNTWFAGAITNAAGLGPSCIHAISEDTAWVAMFNPAGGGKVLKTTDGGLSWTHQATATFTAPAGFPNVVHFFDSNNGFCMGDPNGGYFEIYTTVDGGTNWVRTPQANIATHLAGEFGITDVYTTVGNTIWFGTNMGRFYKSIDGGLNWTVAASPYTGFIGGLSFKDANYGIAVEADLGTVTTDAIFTNDGGATWSLLPGNTATFAQKQGIIHLPGTASTFVITSPYLPSGSGVTFDDGNTWSVIDGLIHSDADFVDSLHGWTGGGEAIGPIYKWQQLAADDVAADIINMTFVGTTSFNPTGDVKNVGSATQSFNVTMTITGGYSSTKTVSNLAFGQTQTVTFDPWLPAAGTYLVTMYTSLATDANLLNDTITKSVTCYPEFVNYGWISKQPIPTARFGLSGGFIYQGTYPTGNGYLYTDGGADLATGMLSTNNDEFDITLDAWSAKAPMPTAKYQFSMQRAGNKLYAFGGYSGGFTPDPNCYIYDPVANSWTSAASMPTPVGDYASGVYNDSLIYYIGGFDGAADQNMVQIYNVNTDSWTTGTAKIGTAAGGLRGGIYQDKIVVVGGFNQLLGAEIDEAHMGTISASNPSTITWSALPAYPAGTVGRLAAGVTFGGTIPLIVFVGGDPVGQGTAAMDYTFGYDVVQNGWFVGPPKPTGVSNVSDFVGTVFNDSLYLTSVSGYNGSATVTVSEWLNMGGASALAIKNIQGSAKQIVVYPNPNADGKVTVLIPSATENYSLEVINYLGQTVAEQNVNRQKSVQLNLSAIAKGIYSVKLSNEKENYTAKIVLK